MSDEATLARIQRALIPFDVYVKDAHANLADDFDPKALTSALAFQIRHGVHGEAAVMELADANDPTAKCNALRYVVDTGVRFIEEDAKAENGEPLVRAEIKATWIVEYRVLKLDDVDEAGVSAFGENNVMYHVWPYWREFIHATCARLRLPQVVLPMFRVRRRVSQKLDQDSKPAAERLSEGRSISSTNDNNAHDA